MSVKKIGFKVKNAKPEYTRLVSASLMGPESGAVCAVDCNCGRITRINPYEFDVEYTDANCNPWHMEARGKRFDPPKRVNITHMGLCYKTRVYSPNRILYPMKRVDWDPNGERHPEMRGISGYERISWDEAAKIIADEIRRVQKTYAPEAVLVESDMHGEGKNVAPSHGCPNRMFSLLGGYTQQMRNMDSWEGWYWGAKHVWGCEPVGEQNPQGNLIPDMAKNCDALFFWGCDPEVTPLGFGMKMPTLLCNWFTELGIKSIYICPELNYGAAIHADKWIPVYPNTDAALQLAIAYQWITQETYDKEYIATHSYGFEKFVAYVLGEEDGIPKTPKWASEKCGVPVWTIKALADYWAKSIVSICHGNGGSYIRGPYGTEPARLEIMLLGMRGLGKPGVHQCKMIEWNMWAKNYPLPYTPEFTPITPHICDATRTVPGDIPKDIFMNRFAMPPSVTDKVPEIKDLFEILPGPKQYIPRCLVQTAIVDKHAEWTGMSCFSTGQNPRPGNVRVPTVYDQFCRYQYPRPGMSRIHMIWSTAPCNITCWNDGFKFQKAYRDPDIECMVVQHPWMENDCYFADILLPVLTKHEMHDIGNDMSSGTYVSIYKEEPCIEPRGESLSDFDICVRILQEFGEDYVKAYTGGLTEEERVRFFYKATGCEERMSFEEWNEKKIFVVPVSKDTKDATPGFGDFVKDPEEYPLETPTGLLEYSSSNIEKYMPDDCERPPVAHWVEKGPWHDERLSSERAKTYPLLCMSNHGRWRIHAQCDDIPWSREVETMKMRGEDGYQYEPCWISPREAEKRGIKHGDIVKVFNEKGIVLCAAYVTERLIDHACYVDHGSRFDPIIPEEVDRGGAINNITPTHPMGYNSTGMATSGFLCDVQKVTEEDWADWKKRAPQAFERKFDPAFGVCMEGWLKDYEMEDNYHG